MIERFDYRIMKKRNEILELSFEFALQVIEFSELLEEKRKLYTDEKA